MGGKKKNKSSMIFLFIFNRAAQKNEWVADKLFLGKKKNTVFFFPHFSEKKKTFFPNSSEWVTPKLLPGKKNGTFDPGPKKGGSYEGGGNLVWYRR